MVRHGHFGDRRHRAQGRQFWVRLAGRGHLGRNPHLVRLAVADRPAQPAAVAVAGGLRRGGIHLVQQPHGLDRQSRRRQRPADRDERVCVQSHGAGRRLFRLGHQPVQQHPDPRAEQRPRGDVLADQRRRRRIHQRLADGLEQFRTESVSHPTDGPGRADRLDQ